MVLQRVYGLFRPPVDFGDPAIVVCDLALEVCVLEWRRRHITWAPLHFAEYAFPLHFLFQDAKSLIDVVIADVDLHRLGSGCFSAALGVTRTREHLAPMRPASPGRMLMLR
jgi:hypothetical protein